MIYTFAPIVHKNGVLLFQLIRVDSAAKKECAAHTMVQRSLWKNKSPSILEQKTASQVLVMWVCLSRFQRHSPLDLKFLWCKAQVVSSYICLSLQANNPTQMGYFYSLVRTSASKIHPVNLKIIGWVLEAKPPKTINSFVCSEIQKHARRFMSFCLRNRQRGVGGFVLKTSKFMFY